MISAEKTEIHRGFPIYLSGASNPKGSGAQYCSPPDTVLGIETPSFATTISQRSHCSPPDTVLGIETNTYAPVNLALPDIAALQIPFSVLKLADTCSLHIASLPIAALQIPFSVLKLNHAQDPAHDDFHIAALQIPFSVLKLLKVFFYHFLLRQLQPSRYRSRY